MNKPGIIVGLALLGSGLVFISKKSERPIDPAKQSTVAIIARQNAAHDLSKTTFDELSQKLADKRHSLKILQDFSKDTEEVYEELAQIQLEKRKIMNDREIRDGALVLSTEERDKLAELNAQEIEKQERILKSIHTLKEL